MMYDLYNIAVSSVKHHCISVTSLYEIVGVNSCLPESNPCRLGFEVSRHVQLLSKLSAQHIEKVNDLKM